VRLRVFHQLPDVHVDRSKASDHLPVVATIAF
jgi:endonuclease/exonuclease/phosphatase family metal-dependent hydrolase